MGGKRKIASDLARVDKLRDQDIDFSENPPTTRAFWARGQLRSGGRPVSVINKAAAAESRLQGDLDRQVAAALAEARKSTKTIIERERQGELVSRELLNSVLSSCHKR